MYSKILSHKNIPQNRPLNERQVPNAAGGHAYPVSDWEQLDRFLILGATGGNFYFGEYDLAKQNLDAVMRCIDSDGTRVVGRTAEISTTGRAVRNDPAIFALALVLKHGNEPARHAAAGAIKHVCRTGTHILMLAAEVEGLGKGWGRSLKRGVAQWFLERDENALAYQALKYGQRSGWSLRDLLRLSHPKASENAVFRHILKGGTCGHPMIDAAESLKRFGVSVSAKTILDHRLPREAVPTELLNSPEIWEALLESMPLTAMIRNLGKLTQVGVLGSGSAGERLVLEALSNSERLRRARVHPLSLLIALAVYRSGRGVKGSLSWTPVGSVNAALSQAVVSADGFGTCLRAPDVGRNRRFRLDAHACGRYPGAFDAPGSSLHGHRSDKFRAGRADGRVLKLRVPRLEARLGSDRRPGPEARRRCGHLA
jgi:60 kDa SS-A/Ro ribonucleoprotein